MSITVTDLFCGAGGSSIGAEVAGATLRLGLNHSPRAIETHSTNFQHADHDCEDVSSLTTAQIRRYPDSDVLLASPECTNHSLAKGARRRKPQAASLWEDGPAGDDEQDRSRATMWDVVRFAEQKLLKGRPYKVIIVENVEDAFWWGPERPGFKKGDGTLFDAWLIAMRALDYEHEVVWLNSMLVDGSVPQSRDRMYVVFWRRGMRPPNLVFEPPSWCPACETLVDGRQTFKVRSRRKAAGRAWGRYGQQYFYTCPDCGGTVFPGAAPAEVAIDWTVPAPLIGERDTPLADATRERVRRGLERILREPFAIRIGGTGNPRPLTLPLITLTARHELAMVMPVAGSTSETTPGNRARRADLKPLGTISKTFERALVLSGTENDIGRDVVTEPSQVQVCSRAPRLVLSNRAHNVPRRAEEEPSHPVLTGEHLAVVVPNEKNTTPRIPDRDPVHAVKAGGQHHALVMRNNESRGDRGQMCTPAEREPIRALTTACHQSLIVPYSTDGEPKIAAEQAADTLTQQNKTALVVPYDSTGNPRPADLEPTPTLTRRDRVALAVVTNEQIDDCGFRMFELHEISRAMAMHEHPGGGEYIVLGNKRERMSQYGNAVTPPVMRALLERCLEVLG